MKLIMKVALVAIALGFAVAPASAGIHKEGNVWVPDDQNFDPRTYVTPAKEPDGPDFVDKLNEINATHAPPCGICDPITRATPDGTYTLPRQNR